MRREELYLRDICEASDSIARFILGLTPAEFRESDLVGSAVVQKLAVIGEAAARVSADLRLRHPENPLAGNHRVPQYSGARVLRHRLGRGMAGSRQTGSRAALPGRRRSRCRVRFSARLTNRCGPCAAPRLTAPGPADVNVPSPVFLLVKSRGRRWKSRSRRRLSCVWVGWPVGSSARQDNSLLRRGARTRACSVETYLDASSLLRPPASARVPTRHARVRAPRRRT